MNKKQLLPFLFILTACSDNKVQETSDKSADATQTVSKESNVVETLNNSNTIPYSILKEETRGSGTNIEGTIKMNETGKVNVTEISIQIQTKVEESELTQVALDIQNKRQGFERIYIRFYLPDQKVGKSTPWATASFDPTLKVDLTGSTASQDTMTSKLSEVKGKVIGKWRSEESLQGAAMVLFKANDKLFMKTTFNNGQSMEDEIATKNKSGKKIYDDGNSHGEYYIIESNGNLGMYGRDGKFDEAKKIN